MTLELTEGVVVFLQSDHDAVSAFLESALILEGQIRGMSSGNGKYVGIFLPEAVPELMAWAETQGEDVLVTVWGRGTEGDSALEDKDVPWQPTHPYTADDAKALRRPLEEPGL